MKFSVLGPRPQLALSVEFLVEIFCVDQFYNVSINR
ncbi:hypothetical protein B6C95_04765 [Staphylococcus epidermidis]|nr:hypothetical protein B6C95_04765 [Staphylococcus epidermidis]